MQNHDKIHIIVIIHIKKIILNMIIILIIKKIKDKDKIHINKITYIKIIKINFNL